MEVIFHSDKKNATSSLYTSSITAVNSLGACLPKWNLGLYVNRYAFWARPSKVQCFWMKFTTASLLSRELPIYTSANTGHALRRSNAVWRSSSLIETTYTVKMPHVLGSSWNNFDMIKLDLDKMCVQIIFLIHTTCLVFFVAWLRPKCSRYLGSAANH